MKELLEKIKEWNQIFGIPQNENQTLVHRDEAMLRFHLLYEELIEYKNAVQDEDLNRDDKLTEILDALVDIQYLLIGAVRLYGFQEVFVDAFSEVHRSNLSKLENGVPIRREDGKILKGSNYFKPDLKQFIK